MKDKKVSRFGIKTSRGKKKNVKPLERFSPKKKEKENLSWREDLARHRAHIAKCVLIFVGVLILATAFFYIRYITRVYTSYDVYSSVDYQVVTGAKVEALKDRFVIYGNDGAKCVDAKGETVWNITYEMQNPMINIDDDVVGIADYNGSVIYMMNRESVLGEINTGMPIRLFRVSAKGLAIAALDDGQKTPIYIYNTENKMIAYFNTTMRNSGFPIAMAISDAGYLVGISYLYADETSYKTNIAFYNFSEVGQNKTDNLVSGNTYANAVVPHIQFVGNSKAVAIADNRLMVYSGDEIPTSSGEVLVQEEIVSAFFGEEYVALVHNNTGEEGKYRIDIYNGNGKCEDTIYYNEEYTDMFFHDGRIIVYGTEHCYVHNVGGIDKYQGELGPGVLGIIPTNVSNRFVVITNSAIETIELK